MERHHLRAGQQLFQPDRLDTVLSVETSVARHGYVGHQDRAAKGLEEPGKILSVPSQEPVILSATLA